MKKTKNLVLVSKAVFAFVTIVSMLVFNSCKKEAKKETGAKTEKVDPGVPDCGTGYHWDYTLSQCVEDCPAGYTYCPVLGYCIPSTQTCASPTNTPLTVVANYNNPNEIVGQKHNSGMDAVMPYYNDGNLEPTAANLFPYTNSYASSQGYDTTAINSSNNYLLQNYGAFYQQSDVAALANQMYSNGAISMTAKNYLLDLANYINSFSADSFSIPSQSSYNSFANNLIAKENQFSGNLFLTANDKYILFSAYSVARYSAVYAVNYSIQVSSGITASRAGTQRKATAQTTAQRSWFSWKSVVGGDVVGAAAGALGGAVTGVMVGGIGAGPGAAAGAVGGGISASAYEAGIQVWHHFFD